MLRTPETHPGDIAQLTRCSCHTSDPLPVDLRIEEIYAMQEIELHRGRICTEITGSMVRSFRRGTGLFERHPQNKNVITPPPEEVAATNLEASSQEMAPVVFDIQTERRRRSLIVLGQPALDAVSAV